MTAGFNALPLPGTQALIDLIPSTAHRVIYEYIYGRNDDPPTMVEIRAHAATFAGEDHSQTDRRFRDLRDVYGIDAPCRRINKKPRYVLEGLRDQTHPGRRPISGKLKAQVLHSQICAMCGKTPLVDRVKLEVDHKLPLAWGGTDDIENLQPLCEECNHNKQDYYASFDAYSDKIRAAASLLEPHKRIGETLKAFKEAGEPAPSEVVGLIACMIQYQEDWQKRTRELRELGWDFKIRKKKEYGRMRSYYELTKWTPWPAEPIAALIKQIEKDKKLAEQQMPS
ncbi:HNH endonuclease [Arthrobacter sp. ERGS1:01]|uniref:HNH endonuclease n=1 Tax=Arthrobacter sp. ERGS1:01 TaxID=1704044 RepID=UPI0006B4A7A5|nr:HNH endonuclease [Arthrobacter sp. ERGS1:01]